MPLPHRTKPPMGQSPARPAFQNGTPASYAPPHSYAPESTEDPRQSPPPHPEPGNPVHLTLHLGQQAIIRRASRSLKVILTRPPLVQRHIVDQAQVYYANRNLRVL